MPSPFVTDLFSVFMCALAGLLIPLAVMSMLMPTLEKALEPVENFRGKGVVYGLGIVWVVWILALVALSFFSERVDRAPFIVSLGFLYSGLPLVAAGVVFGMIDDAYGDAGARGFKGHIKALLGGRLTTGGLKLLGIGFTSLLTAIAIQGHFGAEKGLAYVVLATCTMALCANLMNLLDLRPGRAIKSYILLLLIAVVCVFVRLPVFHDSSTMTLLIFCLGPIVAIWRFDLGERAMLGDAGANAMGALIGYIFAISLPLWGLLVTTVVLFALNLLSEKISFSKLIEGNAVLERIDRLGRRH